VSRITSRRCEVCVGAGIQQFETAVNCCLLNYREKIVSKYLLVTGITCNKAPMATEE